MTILKKAVEAAIDEMPKDFELKNFFADHRAEVVDMCLSEFGYEKMYSDAESEGREEGIRENRERIASDMLKDGEPLAKIAKYSSLSEETILSIANSLGVTVVA